ncbi:hypothetical protein F4859DRAFT_510707 [Xylaria cf. heliscus]|nr:hypothetical protein F4859DRAFT_510707 [Xylaria cf. heliscus]
MAHKKHGARFGTRGSGGLCLLLCNRRASVTVQTQQQNSWAKSKSTASNHSLLRPIDRHIIRPSRAMHFIYVLSGLAVATAAATIPSTVQTSDLVQGDPQTMQDSAIPYCQCTAEQLICCSDAGCQVLGSCSE